MASDEATDLAELLSQTVAHNRDLINASSLASGDSGLVELRVNLKVGTVDIAVKPMQRIGTFRVGGAADPAK